MTQLTCSDLLDIIRSAPFQTDLQDISSYLASITQEAPIVHLIAKQLWKQKRLYALERNNRHDLTIWSSEPSGGRTSIEFKFNYDTCGEKLIKELKCVDATLGGDIGEFGRRPNNWAVIPRVYQDVVEKQPDIFVWIICERDLTNVAEIALQRIVNWEAGVRFRRTHGYRTDRDFLEAVDSFLARLRTQRPFSICSAEVEVHGDFPSTYHFRLCAFEKAGDAAAIALPTIR